MRKVLNSRIFKIIYTVFVIVFALIISCYILFICLEGKKVFDYAYYIVPDNSMKGSYRKNDVIAVKDIDKIILEVGNDIAYYGTAGGLEGKLIIHRIVSIDNSNKKEILFTTQSVKAPLPDPSIRKKDILGKVMGKVNILTHFNRIVKNQIGFFLVIFLPLVLILIIEIIKTSISLKLEKVTLPEIDKRGKNEKKDKK